MNTMHDAFGANVFREQIILRDWLGYGGSLRPPCTGFDELEGEGLSGIRLDKDI